LDRGHIEPNWDIEDFKALNYNFDTHKDNELLDRYASCGHSKMYMTLYNYFQPNPFPSCVHDYIVPHFNLDYTGVAINLFKPAQYLPIHHDLYGKYKEVNGITTETVTRYMIMLEDSVQGQISQIGDFVTCTWKAGDWFSWDNDDPHAVYNMSTTNRYAIQLTGVKRG